MWEPFVGRSYATTYRNDVALPCQPMGRPREHDEHTAAALHGDTPVGGAGPTGGRARPFDTQEPRDAPGRRRLAPRTHRRRGVARVPRPLRRTRGAGTTRPEPRLELGAAVGIRVRDPGRRLRRPTDRRGSASTAPAQMTQGPRRRRR